MLSRPIELGLSLFVVLFALFLWLVLIPFGIDAPSSMRSILLSPRFWPTILAAGLLLLGVILGVATLRRKTRDGHDLFEPFTRSEYVRLAGFVVLLAVYFEAISWIGMIWSSVLCFAAVVFLTGAKNKAVGLCCALLLPIVLFGFFYHVAGVNIPQSELLRLP
ncbi:tripartite tricarboxylate transporter TctB family protein [Aurantimonas sp. VKM B-3413]|uniref:tripartite tricarboxylate transporter TctB family protein n=1 Tax=Aurantimonas sp. VKM B-3413 TaxID=2779401 RepID=UPI001E45716B|nr:tripartite tricarboxylate transporter TctB family protein [Aurantimonas sp. VKM B-3413]MCB8836252.1 tripartite tricarboxylate transporter TctB family protein [Aurantimonas sp. VKM B-3413]